MTKTELLKEVWLTSTLSSTNVDRQAFETLRALAPEEIEWSARYAISLPKVGKHDQAAEVLAALKKSSNTSTLGVRLGLLEAALAEAASQFETGSRVASRTETLANSQGRTYQTGQARLMDAWALDNLSRLVEAESKAKDALALLSDEGGPGRAWKVFGDFHVDQGHFVDAKKAYKKAASIFGNMGWRSGEPVALNNQAYTYRDLGDLQGARNLFELSLTISRTDGNLRVEGIEPNSVAIVLKRMGNFAGGGSLHFRAKNRSKNGR